MHCHLSLSLTHSDNILAFRPANNILIKLMAVESLVFAPFFLAHTRDGLIFKLLGFA